MHEAKKSRKFAIVLSVLVIVCCVSLIIGSTFAMFSANKQFPISVSGGKIDVGATLALDNAFSVDQNEKRTTYTTKNEDGSITIGEGEPGDSGYFGKVSVSAADENPDDSIVSNVSMEGLAQGSGARFTLSVTNNSTVGMKFIAYLEKGNGDFAAALDVTPVVSGDDSASYTESNTRVIFTRGQNGEVWQSGGSKDTTTAFTFEIYLPWEGTTGLSDNTETMNIVIEAVQSNADTGITVDTGTGTSTSYATFAEALDAANKAGTPTATVKAGDGTHNIPDGFTANKPLTIEGNGDGTVINGDIETSQDLTMNDVTYNGNISASGGNVNIENATINGAINYTGSAAAGQSTFSTLAKVSRAYAPAANAATITLTNATVSVENAATAISVNGANLVLENCEISLNHDSAVAIDAVYVTGGAIKMIDSHITVNDTATGNYNVRALTIDNYSLNPSGTTKGKAANAVSRIENSSLIINTASAYEYGTEVFERFSEQAVRLISAKAEFSNTTIEAGNGITGFFGSTLEFNGGDIETLWYAVSGNNTRGSFDITLDGANVVSTAGGSTIYLPMQNTTIIKGGTYISGYTPLEIRMGSVTIDGATLESTADSSNTLVSTDQSTPDGSAIALHANAYTFTDHPESSAWLSGYEDPYKSTAFYKSNTLYLMLTDATLLTKEGVRGVSYYHWNSVEQPVTIVNSAELPITGLAADATALRALINQNYCSTFILVNDMDTTSSITFGADQSIVLDMNGKTLSGSGDRPTIINNGTLTITGNGSVYSTNVNSDFRHAIVNNGTLTIENGTFGDKNTDRTDANDVNRGNALNNSGTAIINGGYFTACDNYTGPNGGYAYAIVNQQGTMTINDAHVYGHMNGAISASGGTLTVNGGTYALTESGTATNLFYMVYTSGSGQVIINDGTFTRDVTNDFGFFYQANAAGKITVNGGNFEDLKHEYINIAGSGQVEINGGTFADVPRVTSQNVTLAFGPNFSLEGRIVTDPALMSIQAYLTAKADLVFTSPITIPQGQTFAFVANGSTLTGKIINYGTLTITGKGTITNAKDDKNHTITNYGTLTIGAEGVADGESIIVDNLTHGTAAVHNDVGATFTFNSGKLLRSNENGQNANDNGGNSFYNLRNYGTVIINGGTIEHDGKYSSLIENGWQNGTQNTQQAEAVMVINGGTFSGGLNTIKNDDWGVMTINDGTFVNMAQHAVLNWNVVEINGGSFTAQDGAKAILCNGYLDDTMDKGQMVVTGGTFGTEPIFMANGTPAGGMIVVNSEDLYEVASEACANTQMEVYYFVGGDGSESNPFGIAGQKQLEAVRAISALAANSLDADAWYANLSYALTQNVTVGEDFSTLRYFNGKLDGKNFTLDLSAMGGAFSEDAFGNLTFKNITFVLSGNIASYVNWTNGYMAPNSWLMYGTDVLFENVVTKTAEGAYLGDQSLLGSNIGAFISQIFNESDLTFRNCTNYADIYARYGAPFIGGYASNCTVTFENCVNYGDVHAQGAAMLVGNANQYTSSEYTVKDCVNYGTISGMSHAGLNVGLTGDNYDSYFTDELTNGKTGDGVTGQITSTGVTVTVNVADDSTITANYVDEGSNTITQAIVYLYGYVYVYQEDNFDNAYGTALTYFDQQVIELEDSSGAAISGITLKRLPVYDGRTTGFVSTGDSNSTPGGIDKGTLNGNEVYYISEEFSFGGFESIGDAAYAASSSGMSMTPTVAVFLYAGDQVVGIGVPN